MSIFRKIKSGNLLNFLSVVLCLFLVLGCNLGKSDEKDDKKTPVSSETPKAEKKNPAVGTWVGKAYDGKTDLKMIFTETDWTLISGGKEVMTKPYTIKDNNIEVEDGGEKLPIDLEIKNGVLHAETKDGKTTLKRQ